MPDLETLITAALPRGRAALASQDMAAKADSISYLEITNTGSRIA
jgi:hypothetical protein